MRAEKPLPTATVVAATFAVALALRLLRLDAQSLWHDEAFTILAARRGFGAMVEALVEDFNHPPLHYLLVHGSFALLGAGAFAARLPSALLGAAAVPLAFLLGRRLFDRRTGLLGAALACLSQQLLVHSQTARGYAHLAAFSAAAMLLLLHAVEDRSQRAWWGAVVAAVLALYSHFYGGLVVLACLAWLAARGKLARLPLPWIAGGAALAALLFAPWLASGVVERVEQGETPFAEQSEWRAASWRSLPDTLDAFNNGRVAGAEEDSPPWAVAVAGLLFLAPAAFALSGLAARDRRTADGTWFLLLQLALPIGVALVLGTLGLAYRVRYVSFALVPYYLLVARGLATLPDRVRRPAIALCLAWSLLGARAALFLPYRAEYPAALAAVARGWREGDALVFSPWDEPTQWELYREDHPELVTALFRDVVAEPEGADLPRRVWLLTYLKPGARGRAYRFLERFEERWRRLSLLEVYQLDVGLYERIPRAVSATGGR